MPQVPAAAQMVARQVLSRGVGDNPDPTALVDAATDAEARLGRRLADLIGQRGYSTLVARAVHLAQSEIPALACVRVAPAGDGSLQGVRAFAEGGGAATADPRSAMAGLTAILAQIIGLLIAFIGEDLALRLVREAWPELADDHAALEAHV